MSTSSDNNDQRGGDSEKITSNKEECTSCEQNNDVENITKDFNGMGVSDMSTCANCGKEGNSDDMNTCNKCQLVKYCNAACKKKHRKKHKKACERRVAELHEEALFKEIERNECPICLQILPMGNEHMFKSCCGKVICNGCSFAMQMSEGKDLCPFCRTPPPDTDEEEIKQLKKQMDKGNGDAFCTLGGCYANGRLGLTQDWNKANELWLKAGELGCSSGYNNLGNSYRLGRGEERDMKKAVYYYELAAMGGDIHSRHALGVLENEAVAGNVHRAIKHFLISASAGHNYSLDAVKKGFTKGLLTKDEYANTLRSYQKIQDEMKSDDRDKAVIYKAEIFRLRRRQR